MYIPKKYGQSKIENCPFCGKRALTQNKQGLSVCNTHKETELEDIKCACGSWLDMQSGKWGPYFRCINCGNLSWAKVMSLQPKLEEKAKKFESEKVRKVNIQKKYPSSQSNHKKTNPKETIITSDEVDFLY